jgi:short-subunit dehydrogenase
MPYPGISLYGPTKAYLRHYTRALRTEMTLYGIYVTCLILGATDTGLYNANKFKTP